MAGLDEYETGVGPCGWHKSLTSDKTNHFTFEDEYCAVCAAEERYRRIRAERDQQWRKRLGDDPPAAASQPSDGWSTHTRLMSPDEVSARAGGSK